MKFDSHKGNQYGAFNPSAFKKSTQATVKKTNNWMHKQGQLCVKCQKESIAEKGCQIKILPGLKLYICKTCVDAKKEAL